MTENFENHPLNGIKLDQLLGELVRHYGWEILADQIDIKCFQSYPSFASSVKFLRKTEWARERLEAFYLYRFKQYPLPTEEQHQLSPRNRILSEEPLFDTPAHIELGEGEFFDDPDTGPVFPSKRAVQKTRQPTRKQESKSQDKSRTAPKVSDGDSSAPDPWAKWRNKI